jgi:hypothetical protein
MGATPFSSPEIDKINAGRYKRDLEHAKNILHGAMKELTLDRTLFKKIQTTPESVEVTLRGEYYLSSGIEGSELIQAIQSAFEGSGLSFLHGKDFPLQQRIDQIKRTSFGIYDISNSEKIDPLLEIGAALGLGRKVVILYKKGFSIPEPITGLERIEYEDFPSLIEKLKRGVKF